MDKKMNVLAAMIPVIEAFEAGPQLDLAYLRHWASEIGVANLLTKALQDAGFV